TILYLDEPSNRTTGDEIPASRTMGTISINNESSDVILAGGNVTVNNLTLTEGNLVTSTGNVVTVVNPLTTGGEESFIDGPVQLTIPAGITDTDLTVPIGRNGYYKPIQFVSATTTGAITARFEV